MLVSKIMAKKPVTLVRDDTLESALAKMSKHKVSGCPVVDEKNRVVGILTQSDMLGLIDAYHGIKGRDSLPLILGILKSENFDSVRSSVGKLLKNRVRDHMKKNVITISAGDDVYTAARLMNKHDVNRLPVVAGGKLVGIISREDIVKALAGMK